MSIVFLELNRSKDKCTKESPVNYGLDRKGSATTGIEDPCCSTFFNV